MPRGQGTIEYLLILVAVLGFLGIVALVVSSFLTPQQQSGDVQMDIIECGNEHIWLKGYTKAYDGTAATAPVSISYYEGGREMVNPTFIAGPSADNFTACTLQDQWALRINRTQGKAWLQKSGGGWWEYSSSGSTVTCIGGISNKAAIALSGTSYCVGDCIGTNDKSLGYTYWQASTYPAVSPKYGFVNFTLPTTLPGPISSAKVCAYYEQGLGNHQGTDFVSVTGSSVTLGSENIGGTNYYCKSVTPATVQGKLGTRIDFKWEAAAGDTSGQYTQWSDETAGIPAGVNKPFMEICYTTP